MSIKDMRRYVELCLKGNSTISERLSIIRAYEEHARQQLRDAEIRAAYMRAKLTHYEEIAAGYRSDEMNPGTW